MSKKSAKASVSSFADLQELYAEETATDAFAASFGDPLPLSIIEKGDEPGEHTMPEPFAAQKVCGELITSLFLLLDDTRLSPLAPDAAWGIVNSFHFVAGTLERREDRLADKIREMSRRMEPGEVFNKELEDAQLECQSLAEQRAAFEAMRDYAAAMYRACWRRAWAPTKGSKASSVTTASYVNALDFLRERALAERERVQPQGPVVVFSGPALWEEWEPLWAKLDQIKARVPHMTLVTTGQRKGADAIAAAWAAREGVPVVAFGLYGGGKKPAFTRNRKLIELRPVEAVLCEGSGIQANLYQSLRKEGVPIHAFQKPKDASNPRGKQGADPVEPKDTFRRARHTA
ncbi:SLOG family protein [Sphingobium aquiterrae]|uniref:SLOG family protein n=1 Tax=Sphingobium aquiterrae TaxID=2038656 RepID=UPI00301992C7|tara:strand:+ start:18604 stop:19641 length:1038 start_codon:yes stop_codon:yes gene_type:complete